MEGAIVRRLEDDTSFLQHEDLHLDARQLPFSLEVNADEPNLG